MLFLLVFRAIVVLGAMAKSVFDGDWADVGDKIYRVVSMAALLFGHSQPIDQVCTHNQIHRTEKLRLPRHANFSFIVVAIPCA
jgi:hypothetical protein